MIRHERIRREEFDFEKYRASEKRHSIHVYPAMLHYKLVSTLIQEYSSEGSTVYDPFCGSGVTIVESLKLRRHAIGTDINPLALLIADVRSSNIKVDVTKKYLNEMTKIWGNIPTDIPSINNVSYWFKDYVIYDLGKIRQFIKTIEDKKIFKFFLVVFSQTVRDVSNNRKGEFKKYRLDEKKLKDFNPNVLEVFTDHAYKYLSVVEKNPLHSEDYSLFLHDIRNDTNISNVDLVITSPPYGDSKTTVAYGQFSSFSLEWLQGLNPYGDANVNLDKLCLGGNQVKEIKLIPSNILQSTLEAVQKLDPRRSKEVYSFFYDYYASIKNIVRTLNNTATVCFIVGNRTVKGINIEMDLITAEFFESFGLNIENIFTRKISNKRMPHKNSPSNKPGQISDTMSNEYIVIARRSTTISR